MACSTVLNDAVRVSPSNVAVTLNTSALALQLSTARGINAIANRELPTDLCATALLLCLMFDGARDRCSHVLRHAHGTQTVSSVSLRSVTLRIHAAEYRRWICVRALFFDAAPATSLVLYDT